MKISIPTPCHEKWEEMTPNERGRFCANCQKTVIDFTGWTEKELAELFTNNGKNACGRFRSSQLNNELTQTTTHRKSWMQTFLALSLIYFATKPSEAIAQAKKQDTLYSNAAENNDKTATSINDTLANTESEVKGLISDEKTDEPIIGCITELLDEQHKVVGGALSDINGYFFISNIKPGRYKLVAKYPIYKTKESEFFDISGKDTVAINLALKDNNTNLTMGIIVTNYSPRYWRKHPWQFIKKKVLKIESL